MNDLQRSRSHGYSPPLRWGERPAARGGDHAHRLSASPKGGREGGRTKIPLYKFIDNSVSIPLPAFIYG